MQAQYLRIDESASVDIREHDRNARRLRNCQPQRGNARRATSVPTSHLQFIASRMHLALIIFSPPQFSKNSQSGLLAVSNSH
jgi:hypothetical protein